MAIEFYNRNWRMANSWTGTEDNNTKFSNYSMSFDGAENIDIGNSISVSGNCTVSFWFKVPAIPNATPEVMFARYTGSGDTDFFIIGLYLQGVLASNNSNAGGSKTTRANVTLSPNTWHHCAVTKVSGIVTNIYIDGTDRAGSVGSFEWWSAGSTDSGFIGQKANADSLFDGNIDHLSIFDYALSQAQVTELYGSSSTGIGNPMAITNGRKPVAYYPLGDYSAFNGEYLVPNSAVSDYVFDFDGSNDYVDCSNNTSLQITNNLTVSTWIKTDSTSFQGIIYKGLYVGTTGAGSSYAMYFNTAGKITLQFYLTNTEGSSSGTIFTVTTSNSYNDGKWHNITAIKNLTSVSIYIDNTLDGTATATLNYIVNSTQNVTIGSKSDGSFNFNGSISNVSIFNTALPATGTESVQSLYNYGTPPDISSYSGLQGFWKLDASSTFDGSSWSIPDSSSNSNTGTSSGMTAANLVQSNLNILSPYSRYALNFDSASSERIDTASISTLDNTTQFTISTWAYWNTTGNTNEWLFMAANSNRSIRVQLELENQKIYFRFMGATGEVRVNMINSAWVNVVAVFNANAASADKMIIYLNGARATNIAYTEPTGNSPTGMTIASIGGRTDGYGFNGKISNFSIWNTALTSAQVTEIYSNGLPSNLNNHSAYSNLVSWWQLGENSSFNTNWTVIDEKGTNNGTSVNMAEDDLVDGVGTTANGLSSGMGGADNIVGEGPFSDGNSLSYGMGADAKSTDVPS